MEKTKVLFVDDDIALGQVVILALRASGYAAEYCTTLVGIQGVVQEMQPDIMVLDVEIGEKNGIDAVVELKLTAPDTPILFVSSHIAGSEVARALDAGGIAYLRKPFEMEELVAYIRRHTPYFHPKGLSIGMFNLRAGDSMLFKGEEPVRRLTEFEYKLLKLLAQNMNQTVSREQIVQELWEGTPGSEQSLNNYVARLRKYLSEDESLSLETVPRTGYMLSILGTQPRVL